MSKKIYEVKIARKAAKNLKKYDSKLQQRVFHILDRIKIDPFNCYADTKKLKGESDIYYRIRVGKFRIVYTVKQQELLILVVKIDHRGSIY